MRKTRDFFQKKWVRAGLVILSILIVVRILLPFIILKVVNKELSSMKGYYGQVKDIDLALFRGAYTVKDIFINKVNEESGDQTELFLCPLIDISIEWRSLFKGRIVSELELSKPVLAFTAKEAEPEQMEKDSQDFKKILKTFTPISVNRFEITEGELGFKDPNINPKVDIALTNAHVVGLNLSNVQDTSDLPARINAMANIYGGILDLKMRLDALAEDPTYDINLEVKGTELTKLNEFFKAYGKFDVNKGTFGMYMEMAANDRKFLGYVKPFIDDLDIAGPEDRKDAILQKLWEGILGVVGDILEAPDSDKIATKIPIAGEYGDRRIGTWYAVWGAIKNGLFTAMYPALDHQVNLQAVNKVKGDDVNKDGFFKKVFGGPGEADKERKDKKDK